MRQDVKTSCNDGRGRLEQGFCTASRWLLLDLWPLTGLLTLSALLFVSLGCQATQPLPTTGVPSSLGRGLTSSYKPPQFTMPSASSATAGSSAAQPAASMRVRGQSPTQPYAPSQPFSPGQTYSPGQWNPNGAGQYPTTPLPTQSPPVNYATPYPNGGGLAQPAPSAPGGLSNAYGGGAYGNSGYGGPNAAPSGTAVAPLPGNYGYAAPNAYSGASPSDYGSAIAPGATLLPDTMQGTVAPGAFPALDPSGVPYPDITAPGGAGYRPRQRISPIDVYVQEARTGRIILGGSVNSDLGVAGQLVIDERNFDIRRFPSSWGDLWSGKAFRGGGQNFRAEFMPGNQVQRYTVNWTNPNLFGYLPYSLSVGGFYYTRQYRDWTEQRLGGRAALGYAVTKDLSISSELRMEDVNISSPRIAGVSELDSALGSNDIYTARFRVARDTRDSPFMSTEGALLELIFDQVFGEYDYSRGNLNYSRYFMVRERPDGGGRHTIASTWKFGVTGSETPIFENYFAGGYSTLRGFSFRGASPKINDVQVGGEMMFLGSLEYVFPLTADEMLRGVAFVDYGTVEQDLKINSENFRVAPGLGVRVSVPALGPAPLAFDFAYPINHADGDDRQVFSFFMGFTR